MTTIEKITIDRLHELRPLGELATKESTMFLPGEYNYAAAHDFWKSVLGIDRGVLFAAKNSDGKIIGDIGGVFIHDPLYGKLMALMQTFYVTPENRKTGVGQELIKAFEDESLKRGVAGVVLECEPGVFCKPLSQLYKRRGYKLAGLYFWKENK